MLENWEFTWLLSSLNESVGIESVAITPDTNVDHASQIKIHGAAWVKIDFLKDVIKEILMDPTVGVRTGNDNEGPDEDWLLSLEEHKKWQFLIDNQLYVSKPGNYYLVLLKTYRFPVRYRISFTNEPLKPEYPESIDVKITDYCENNCKYCHESASPDGNYCDFEDFERLIQMIYGHTLEIAIGGGNPLVHPDFFKMIQYAKRWYLIPNFTVKDKDWLNFLRHDATKEKIELLKDVGIGISVSNISTVRKLLSYTDKITEEFFGRYVTVLYYTFHVINQVHSTKFVKRLVKVLREYYMWLPQILVLGYKEIGRGKEYKGRVKPLDVKELLELDATIMFDDLAIEQLNVKQYISKEDWDKYYAGRDGEFTMYIDLVNKQFAKSSATEERYDMAKFNYITEMFDFLRRNLNGNAISEGS
jgi:hypothetical protein